MEAHIAEVNQNAAARSAAHFSGYALGAEHAERMRVSATDTKVVRVYVLAVKHGRVADGTLRAFWRAWRLAEALCAYYLPEAAVTRAASAS